MSPEHNDITYDQQVVRAVDAWRDRINKEPYYSTQLARRFQRKVNRMIPEKVHAAITAAVRRMTETVCLGVGYTSTDPLHDTPFEVAERRVDERITFYAKTAAAEGALTGAGGILLGLADFPLWLTLKMKMLFEISALYGYDATDYKERIFLLHIFELTFSGYDRKRQLLEIVSNWEEERKRLPPSIDAFDWQTFQQEYRDYIDVAKLLQLVPGIGAAVGTVVNYRLTGKLGQTAKNAYRLRWLAGKTAD
ncbi:MAG TPA: EcsC family protein [Chryseolinea sp.]|nr:EcsC family protein [Chryseolinea sp.]